MSETLVMVEPKAPSQDETSAWLNPDSFLPIPYRWVLYKTDYYQAAGYVGRDGTWFCCSGTRELVPVIGWSELS